VVQIEMLRPNIRYPTVAARQLATLNQLTRAFVEQKAR